MRCLSRAHVDNAVAIATVVQVAPKVRYEVLDPEVLARYERLEERLRDCALALLPDSDDLDEVEEGAHLVASVLISVAYSLLQDSSSYDPRRVFLRYLRTVEAAERGDLVFIEPTGVNN